MASQLPDPIPSSDAGMDSGQEYEHKVFMDPIHGHIDLHPLCVKIVDTPFFQRLRFIKQLGAGYYVYPGACHNRFEHSLGVCYLAGQLARAIQRRQRNLDITDVDILCVEIAGLCHDLGHGPFSHMFDKAFIPATRRGYKWKHETASIAMFDHMLKEGGLDSHFKEYLKKEDITFIRELMVGRSEPQKGTTRTYKGRRKDKSFLYDIVANKRNGIDVDKWDYFARDCHMLGIKNSFDHMRCIQFARVIKREKGNLQICFRDKEAVNLYGMFHTRWGLYHRAYQHRVVKIIEHMITEAMEMANSCRYFRFKGKKRKLKMSEAIDDMVAYRRLTDDVFLQILNSDSGEPPMKKAKGLLEKVQRRELYTFVAQAPFHPKKELNENEMEEMKKKIIRIIKETETDSNTPKLESIVILLASMDYGDKTRNPMDKVYFYTKNEPDVAYNIPKNQVSWMLPSRFAEKWLRVYSKESDTSLIQMIKNAFMKLCKDDKRFTDTVLVNRYVLFRNICMHSCYG